jgi:hypothetical protein
MLARVQSHRGCASITSVGPEPSRANVLAAGQRLGASAGVPGVLSYAISHPSPVPTEVSHTTRTAHSSR